MTFNLNMPRIKSIARSIFTYKEKRYTMNPIFEENEPDSPLTSLTSSVSSPVVANDVDLPPPVKMKRQSRLFEEEFITFDIFGLYEDLVAIRSILKNFPFMNHPNVQSDMYRLESNLVGEKDTNHGRYVIITGCGSLSKQSFVIEELLLFHDFTEEYTLTVPKEENTKHRNIRMFWSQ